MQTIQREKGRHFIEDGDGVVGEITYSTAGNTAYIVDHTFVRPSHREQGIAKQLLDSVVEEARANDRKIMPLCPYARAQFEKDASYADVSVL